MVNMTELEINILGLKTGAFSLKFGKKGNNSKIFYFYVELSRKSFIFAV
jgi:hypothetical protein